jgi:hypothetical protein
LSQIKAVILTGLVSIDSSSAIWGYGFGRMEAEREAKEKAKRIHVKEIESAVALEKFEVNRLKVTVTIKNIGNSPARVFNVILLEVLREPKIMEKKGLFRKKTMVKVAEIISKVIHPEIFTILSEQTFTYTIDLTKPLEAYQKYMLELHMGEHEFYSRELADIIVTKLGWAYMLEFNGEKVKEISTMNLEQAGIFWGKLIAQAKGKRNWENIYVRFPWAYERYPYELY